ncbi:MAG TPA: hypothetical protein VIH95_12240 [Acidimicrobiales bacterium]
MDRAIRADATPPADRGESSGVRGPDRTPSSVPGAGIGLPHIRARSAVAPAPVPSISDPVEADTVESDPLEPDAVEAASAGVDRVEDVPGTAPLPASFPPGVAAKLGCYVYLLVDARSGRPFFVGRGRGERCHRHVEAARGGASTDDSLSKYPLLDRIRVAEADGRPVRIEILRHGLTPAEADLVESSVADALGLGHATRLDAQRRPADEVAAALAKRAKFKRGHQVVLLRVGPHGVPTEYASVRHGWRIGRRWIDTDSRRSPLWAVVVAGDLVDAVYRIDAWEPSPSPTGTGAGTERFSFVGTPATELDARYAGRSVRAYLGGSTPNAVTYVWCGPHWVDTAP